jgi:pimeloyl-ACP methyl ester carboxylesterase
VTSEVIRLESEAGVSHAQALGDGPVVLCLHGFPDCSDSFRHQLPALAEAGFRGVAPLLRGYEPSSQPGPQAHHYHPLRVARDAVAFAEQLAKGGRVHLLGHDWGAIAAYPAVCLAPERFASLSTLAVAGPRAMGRALRQVPSQLRKSWYVLFFQLRGLADRRVARDDFAFVERLWRDWSPGWRFEPEAMEAVKQTLRQPGVLRSALSYYRALLNPFLADGRALRELAERPVPVPTLALTGARDGCLDTRVHDLMEESDFPAGLRVERIDGTGHFLHQESPAAVNARLLDWLRTHPA